MAAPLIGAAAIAAAKLIAKKLAKNSASKATIIGIKSGRSTGNVKAVLRSNDKLGVNRMTKGSNRGIAKKANTAKGLKAAVKTAKKSKPLAEPKSAVKVKPAAKPKPNKPNPSKIEYKFGMGINRARAKGNDPILTNPGRKNRIQVNKLNKSK